MASKPSAQDVVQQNLSRMYRDHIDSDQAIRNITKNVSKEDLATFIVDAFDRGWISKFNLGLDDEGEII